MEKNKKSEFRDILKLKDLVSIFKKRKWLFVGIALVVFIIGTLFTFIKIPAYKTFSELKFNGIYYDENLYKYFPEEAQTLGIFAPGMEAGELESSILSEISKDFREQSFLEEIIKNLDFDINKEDLNEVFGIFIDGGNSVIRIETTYSDARGVYQINKTLIDTYISINEDYKSGIIESVISSIDIEIENIESQLKGTAVSEDEQNVMTLIMADLGMIKYNLENNKDIFSENVEILREPFVPTEAANTDYLKNMILVILAAIAVGIIAVFLPNIFSPVGKKDND